jgi:hypothetical protein
MRKLTFAMNLSLDGDIAAPASPSGLGFAMTSALLNHGAQTTLEVPPTWAGVAITARTQGSLSGRLLAASLR